VVELYRAATAGATLSGMSTTTHRIRSSRTYRLGGAAVFLAALPVVILAAAPALGFPMEHFAALAEAGAAVANSVALAGGAGTLAQGVRHFRPMQGRTPALPTEPPPGMGGE
jgi:hypothetical protein